MNKYTLATLLLIPTLALADDVAVVISRKPNLVTVNQQSCSVQEVVINNNNTEGKVVGGVAGAALGSTVGSNSRDRLAGAVIGGLIGGAIGNEMTKGPPEVQSRTVCRMVPVTVQQGEYITFQFQGRIFTQLIQ